MPGVSTSPRARRPSLQVVLLLVIGALFGAFGVITWQVRPTARTVDGVVGTIDPTGSALVLSEPEELDDVGFGLVGVLWKEGEGEWQRTLSDDGHPTCLAPGDEGRDVLLGLVTDPGGVDRPASEVVAWLQCPPRQD